MNKYVFSDNINLGLRLQGELAKPQNVKLRRESVSAERVGRLLGRLPASVAVGRVPATVGDGQGARQRVAVYDTGSVRELHLNRGFRGGFFS